VPCTRLIVNKWSNFDGRPHCRGRFLMMRVWDRPICDRRRATFHGGELSVTRTVINFKDCHCPPCWIFRSWRASTCHRIKFHRNRLNRCRERLWQLIVRHLGFIGRVMATPGPPSNSLLVGFYRCAKFGWNRHSTVSTYGDPVAIIWPFRYFACLHWKCLQIGGFLHSTLSGK